MPTDQGFVVERRGNIVTVRIQPQEGCSSCALSEFCVGSKQDSPTVKATASDDIKQGDAVEVTLDGSLLLRATAIMYGIPLLAFLAGVLVGYLWAAVAAMSTTLSMVLPVAGGFLMLIPGVFISRRAGFRLNPTGTVVRKLNQEAPSRS